MIDLLGIIGKAAPIVKTVADVISDSDKKEVIVDTSTPDTVNVTINLNIYGNDEVANNASKLPENLVARMVLGMRYDG